MAKIKETKTLKGLKDGIHNDLKDKVVNLEVIKIEFNNYLFNNGEFKIVFFWDKVVDLNNDDIKLLHAVMTTNPPHPRDAELSNPRFSANRNRDREDSKFTYAYHVRLNKKTIEKLPPLVEPGIEEKIKKGGK